MQKDIRRRKCNTFYMTRKDQSKDSIWEKRERKEKKKNHRLKKYDSKFLLLAFLKERSKQTSKVSVVFDLLKQS